jgi:hypothetical protein
MRAQAIRELLNIDRWSPSLFPPSVVIGCQLSIRVNLSSIIVISQFLVLVFPLYNCEHMILCIFAQCMHFCTPMYNFEQRRAVARILLLQIPCYETRDTLYIFVQFGIVRVQFCTVHFCTCTFSYTRSTRHDLCNCVFRASILCVFVHHAQSVPMQGPCHTISRVRNPLVG